MTDNKNLRKGRHKLSRKRRKEKVLQYFREHSVLSLLVIFLIACTGACVSTPLPELLQWLICSATVLLCVYLSFKWEVL